VTDLTFECYTKDKVWHKAVPLQFGELTDSLFEASCDIAMQAFKEQWRKDHGYDTARIRQAAALH
jgi:hypothetical protein